MEKTCIICPVGCTLNISKCGDEIVVSGNGCPRGIAYAKSEVTNPKRVVTALVRAKNGICSVKTSNAVPKQKINDLLHFLNTLPQDEYKVGQVLSKKPLDLDCDIVVTGISEF